MKTIKNEATKLPNDRNMQSSERKREAREVCTVKQGMSHSPWMSVIYDSYL